MSNLKQPSHTADTAPVSHIPDSLCQTPSNLTTQRYVAQGTFEMRKCL